MTTTLDTETVARIREALTSPNLYISSGLGNAIDPGQGTACTIAEINLVLTGQLSDGPHPCISEVIRRWVIRIQDQMPETLRNSPEWRQAAVGIAGSASTAAVEKTRVTMILEWMWDQLSDDDVLKDVPISARDSWDRMCRNRTMGSAYAASDAAASAAAASAAYAAAYAAAHAAARAAASNAASYWNRADPAGLLAQLVSAS